MNVYINFYFRELEMNENIVEGIFDSPDNDVKCRFRYNIETKEYDILESNRPEKEIIPIPFYWLNIKLKENGLLNKIESKISY